MAIKVKLHRDAFDTLRNSGPVLAELERQGQQVADHAVCAAAMIDNRKHQTLLRALKG